MALTAPIAFQLAPESVEYHQTPLTESVAVMATPSIAPASASVTLSSCPAGTAKSTNDETSVPAAPLGAPASSETAARAGFFDESSTGAEFEPTVMANTSVSLWTALLDGVKPA